jgi:hypothetical protein
MTARHRSRRDRAAVLFSGLAQTMPAGPGELSAGALDSSGLRVILKAREALESVGGAIEIRGAPGVVERVIDMTA